MAVDMEALMEELARVRDAIESAGEEASEEEGTVPAAPAENSTIKAIRAEAKRAEKRAAQAEAERDELRKFKEEATTAAAQGKLSTAGLTPQQVSVFLKAYDEVTDENVRSFKSDVLGVSDDAEEEGTIPAAPFAPAGFSSERSPVVTEGSKAVREYVAKHGVEAAEKAWQEGKLKL